MRTVTETPGSRRFAVIDIARGVAIIAMVAYHLCWDLSYFRFIAPDVGRDPNWVLIARTILASFLFLVGVGLALGHGRGMRWASFWRRWAFVVVGALAISLGTAMTVSALAFLAVHFRKAARKLSAKQESPLLRYAAFGVTFAGGLFITALGVLLFISTQSSGHPLI